ncbi:Phosphodiesterase [Plasmodiophora brassicae]
MFVRVLSVNNAKNKTGVFKQLFRVLRLYQRIVRISQDLGHQTETRAALSRIEDIVYDVMEVQLVNIYLCDRKRNMIECLGSAHDHCSTGFNVKVGEGVVGTVVENPGIVNVTYDDSDDVKLKGMPWVYLLSVEYRGIKVNSMLVGPIADESSDTILGVIQCFNKKNGPFNSTDEVILEQIAKQAANILTTTLRFQEEKKRQDRNDVLMDIVKTVHTNDDIDEIISKVVEASYRVVHCDRVSLFMIDPSTNELWFKVSKDASAAGFRFPIGKGIAGFVASSGESLNIVDAYKDDRFSSVLDRQSNYQTRTILCIPICNFKGKPVAVLQCINKYCMLCDKVPCLEHQVQFEDSDLEIMQTFAREVASALQRKAQESSFQQAMDMDGNRSHMKDYIRQFIGGGNNVSKRRMALTSDQTTPEIEWPVISVKAEASELCDWTFDYFTKTSDEQLGLSEHIFDILELITTFRINRTRLRNFFVEVRKLYKDNPYHNFQHAFSVLHMVFLFVTTTSAKTMLTRADILALTVGAIGHDVGHPGMNNDFLINTEHELAVRYNDASVLENHHAATVCQLMRQENCDFLPEMTRQQRQELRKCMVEAILHTDQSLHKSMLDNLMTKASRFINTNQTINRDSPADRQMLVNNILHCSDIGNPCLPVHMSQEWAKAIQQEFYQQATREKAMGLPYAAFMANDSEEALATLQINFINYVVSPIWKAMHEFLPELTVAMNNMAANKAAWEQAKEKAKAATD